MARPRSSKRRRISPARPRWTASGLIRTSVRSRATGPASLLIARQVLGGALGDAPAPPARRPQGLVHVLGRERHRVVEDRRAANDRRLTERADLPERLQGRLAGRARLAELGRADRADQELG